MTRRLLALLVATLALLGLAGCGEDEPAAAPVGEPLEGLGLAATLPEGWQGRVFSSATSERVLQASNLPLPPADETDFGFAAVSEIPPEGTYVALVDYGAGTSYPAGGVPTEITADALKPNAAPGPFPGAAGGAQRFFTESGRGWALYVVVGDRSDAAARLGPVNALLASVEIAPIP